MVLAYHKNESGEFLCQHCQYTAHNQSTMHYHLKKHEGALPHSCKHCDARFLQKSLLDMHIKSRHSETLEHKETFKCPCNGCAYEDLRKGNRLIHFVRVHLKDLTDSLKCKPTDESCIASCKVCSQNFKSLTQFYYHASKCVSPTTEHTLHKEWNQLVSA
jgi:hypothetical protein